MKITLDHIGIAVNNLDGGGDFYRALGLVLGHREVVESEMVKVDMYELQNSCRIELLESSSPEGPIGKFISKRGPGIHHICLRVENIRSIIKQLKTHGVKLINEEPKPGAHNCLVAFIHPSSTGGVLIELSERLET
jgi:methylmalonyl-CoA/ethylmalonyl-CoA epimerase